MEKRKVCNACHISYDSRLAVCPSCKGKFEKKTILVVETESKEPFWCEFVDVKCDYCPYEYGRHTYCPIIGD